MSESDALQAAFPQSQPYSLHLANMVRKKAKDAMQPLEAANNDMAFNERKVYMSS